MADVEVQMQISSAERKVRKVKKTTKRRESSDDVTITDMDKENQRAITDQGYCFLSDDFWHPFFFFLQVFVSWPKNPSPPTHYLHSKTLYKNPS